jgi:hypothetical protein
MILAGDAQIVLPVGEEVVNVVVIDQKLKQEVKDAHHERAQMLLALEELDVLTVKVERNCFPNDRNPLKSKV